MMNAECLKNAGIDYERCVKRFAGRAQLFEKTLKKFPGDSTFSRIRAAYEAGDKAQFFACVHEFKGMCGNIGMDGLYQSSDGIVRMLRGGAYSETELILAYEALSKQYAAVLQAVQAALEEPV